MDGQKNLLEKEFILLQERADELIDSLNRQNDEFTDERAKSSFGFREMRKLLEHQIQMLSASGQENKHQSDACPGRHEGKPSRWQLSIRKTDRTNSDYRVDQRMPQDGIER